MPYSFVDEPPSVTVKGGNAHINIEGHPKDVVVPIHVLRQFCEVAVSSIERWERERAVKHAVVPLCELCVRHNLPRDVSH